MSKSDVSNVTDCMQLNETNMQAANRETRELESYLYMITTNIHMHDRKNVECPSAHTCSHIGSPMDSEIPKHAAHTQTYRAAHMDGELVWSTITMVVNKRLTLSQTHSSLAIHAQHFSLYYEMS